MRVADTRLFRYSLPLARPLILKSRPVSARHGFVVRLADSDDHVGWGEIAPLPGFSAETLDEACKSAICALRALGSRDLPDVQNLLASGIGPHLNTVLPPSVACGIESAVMNLWARRTAVELRHLIDHSAPDSAPVNGLLSGRDEEVLALARQMLADGYATLKLKVGSEAVGTEIAKVKSLRSIMPPHTRLRLDANRAWDIDTAVQFCKGIDGVDIEYIEEPLADSRDLDRFYHKTGLPYALDETLVSMQTDNITKADGLVALILKPTLLGGLSPALRLAKRARELGLVPVISSAFESSLGLLTLANLACTVAPTVACGLDTASWFADDLLAEPLRPIEGRLRLVNYSIDRTTIRTELLTEIPVA